MYKNFPHILHIIVFVTIHNYSKGARGLSVQPQVLRIFTEISISLRLHWRQQDSHYAIHAGHQLNAKEFRYLWTVRVTAAVYWGLRSKPKLFSLILQHRAGVSLYTSFYKFAETCVFTKQLLSSILCQLLKVALKKLLLIPKLRSHFAEFLQHNYLKRLNLLNLSTCVGFQYGIL